MGPQQTIASLTQHQCLKPTQPSIPPESENQEQIRLGRQRQVCSIPLAYERGVYKAMRSLENACRNWAPKRCVHDEARYKSTFTFTL